jgi:hypothetical protein
MDARKGFGCLLLALALALAAALPARAEDEEIKAVQAFLQALDQPYPVLGQFRAFCSTGMEDNPEDYAERVLCASPSSGDSRLDQRCAVRWRACGRDCDLLPSLALVLERRLLPAGPLAEAKVYREDTGGGYRQSEVTGSLGGHPVEFVLTTRYGGRLFSVFLTKFDNQPLSRTMTPELVNGLLRGTVPAAR